MAEIRHFRPLAPPVCYRNGETGNIPAGPSPNPAASGSARVPDFGGFGIFENRLTELT